MTVLLLAITVSAEIRAAEPSKTKVRASENSVISGQTKAIQERPSLDAEKLKKKAIAIRKKRIALIRKKIAAKDSPELQEKLAKYLLADEQFDEAIQIYRKLLDPNDLDSYLNLASAYRAKKSYLDEIRILNQVVPKWPNYANLYFLQAQAFAQIDKLDDAVIKYRKCLSLQPKYEKAYWGLYEIFKIKKNNYEGRIILHDMIEIFGEKAEYYTELCQNYTEDSYFEESLGSCQVAVRLAPGIAKNHVFLGLTQQYKENFVQAEKILSNAARQFPDDSFAQEAAGQVMLNKENYEVAAKYFANCVKLAQKNLKCLKGLAQSSFQLGDYKLSLQSYKSLCREDRSILSEFKKQAATLRINGKSEWSEKFTEAVTNCYY